MSELTTVYKGKRFLVCAMVVIYRELFGEESFVVMLI